MPYCISYEGEKKGHQGRSVRRMAMTVFFFGWFIWTVSHNWQEGRQLLQSLLIPGDPQETLEAVQVFAQELSCGFTLGDAMKNFCTAVLNHGTSN